MICLFTSLYPEKSETRRKELSTCLERNLANPRIDFVCLLLEGIESPYPDHAKLKVRSISHRPMYQDFFDWANELIDSPNDVTIVANSDIYMDVSVGAFESALQPEACAALARWDVQPDGSAQLFDRNDSQDVWVFKGKIRPVVADYLMGVPRCDNRMIYELREAGYVVTNPAFSVRAYHLHSGERSEYPKQIDGVHVEGPYEYLWPHNLMNLPAILWHRSWHPGTKLGWRIDTRRLQRTLPCRMLRRLKSRYSN
jgi:hypothetical protein